MTTPIGFPPQRSQAILASLLDQLRARGDTARQEAVTGRRADPVKALGGRIAEPIGIARDLADIREYRQAIALAETRSQGTQAVLATLQTLADDLSNQAQLALQNDTANSLAVMSATARDFLGAAVSALNTAIGGRSLFAGDAGDARAIAPAETVLAESVAVLEAAPGGAAGMSDLRTAFDTPGGLFETVIYGGGSGDAPRAEIARGERVALSARADEPPMRDMLRGLAALAAAYDPTVALAEDDRRAIALEAVGDLRNLVDPLNRIVARVGAAEGRMETVKAGHVAAETALTRAFNEFAGADALTAATELRAVEGQLETLFLTTARMSALSLANFLR